MRAVWHALAVWVGIMGWPGMPGALATTNRWDAEVAAFARHEATNAPPARPVVMVGSSSIRTWQTMASDLPGWPVLNRGFGGSHLSDVNHHFDAAVAAARPGWIVLYAGDNDVAAGKSPAEVARDFSEFRRMVRERVPGARCAFLAIKPCPRRKEMLALQREANAFVRAQVEADAAWTFLDTFTPILGPDGQPDPACFKQDQLHLNAEGYRRWTRVLRPWLDGMAAGR